MKENSRSFEYKIEIDDERQSIKIFADDKGHDEIIKFLLRKKHFVKDHRKLFTRKINLPLNSFLEIDYRGFDALETEGKKGKNEREIDASLKNSNSISSQDFIKERKKQENEVEEALKKIKYDLNLRIWTKDEEGQKVYFCDVEGDIYSSKNLNGLISFLKGEYLIESEKSVTSFLNPLKIRSFGDFYKFIGTIGGATEVIGDVFSSNKSLFRYNKFNPHLENNGLPSLFEKKKQFQPAIENIHHLRIVLDGADDTANAMNNTGLPQQTVALLQGLLIFPIFLKGVHLGFEGLGEEAKETYDEYNASHIKKAAIEVKLESFKKELCEKCKIDYEKIKDEKPNDFLGIIANKIASTRDEAAKIEIINLANKYQQEIEEDLEAPEIKDVLAAHCGWLAMTSMMTSVIAYESQAIINIFGGIDKLTKSSKGADNTLFSAVGNSFGFAGQILMTIYAFHKMIDERKSWQEAEEELRAFQNASDVNDLASQITEELLAAKKDNHKLQTFGNAALSAGQAMMAVGGPIAIGAFPVLFTGLGLTLGGVAINSVSEIKYQTSYQINEDMDGLEREIINRSPQFSKEDFGNIMGALARNAKERMLELEILGHLRAPQFILHQKFENENEDDVGILGKAVGILGGNKISKWLNKPPSASIDLVKNNPLIMAHQDNSNDLDIFNVDEEDFKAALEKYKNLKQEGKDYLEIIKTIQGEFVKEKSEKANGETAKSVTEICKSIIKQDSIAGAYLTKKLMRAVVNGDLKYDGNLDNDLPEIRKNGKKITIGELDISKFKEEDLTIFLSHKRKQKGIVFTGQKKSPLEKSRSLETFDKKSDHFRPFIEIGKLSNAANKFFDDDSKETIGKDSDIDEKEDLDSENNIVKPIILDLNKEPSYKKEDEGKKAALDLLNNFKKIALEDIKKNQKQRISQIKKQNEIIDDILKKGKEFILESQIKNEEKNQTIFIYADPNYDKSNPEYEEREYEERKVTYVRNDLTGKIDVLYGQKAEALIIEKPSLEKNGLITKISDNKVEYYGEEKESIFRSFKVRNHSDIPSVKPLTRINTLNSQVAKENGGQNSR